MKYRLTTTLLLGLLTELITAQTVEQFRSSVNISPQAESYQIARSGSLTPSLYTGAMSYSLPLYTYKDPDFEIPLSLDYSYDGYKVARSAGTVGLGWALNFGGIITREIRGLKGEFVSNVDADGGCKTWLLLGIQE